MLRIDASALDYINLYVGIALIVASALSWFWALSRPLSEELKEAERPGQAER